MKRELKKLEEEFTTDMHADLLADEVTGDDLSVMGVYGAIQRGAALSDALKKYGISEAFYNANLERVLTS